MKLAYIHFTGTITFFLIYCKFFEDFYIGNTLEVHKYPNFIFHYCFQKQKITIEE